MFILILEYTSWFFCLRPLSWLFCKLIRNKTVLGFVLEVFYLCLSGLYLGLFIACIILVKKYILAIIGIIFAILGILILGYGIMLYHKTDEFLTDYVSDGYEVVETYDPYYDTVDVDVHENVSGLLTWEGFLAVLTSPFVVLIRLINLIILFRYISNKNYVCDLAIGIHPKDDGALKTIFVDVVNINRYKKS